MKTLYLVRHAKSSWKHAELKDYERPLKKRGKKNTKFMAGLLKKGDEIPDLIISSPAKRAFSTSKIFADELGIDNKKLISEKKLYMADNNNFLIVINSIPEDVNKAMLVSHNPGLTNFVSYISEEEIDNIPTCGVVRIDFDATYWIDITSVKGKLIFFEYPKKYE
jgi:phosphohistidine phosphatase